MRCLALAPVLTTVPVKWRGTLSAAQTENYLLMEVKDLNWLSKLGLNPVHPRDTAWETIFARALQGTFLIISLKDGSRVAGVLHDRAAISTDPERPDLFVDEVWMESASGFVCVTPRRGIWVNGLEIRTLETVEPQ